MLGMPATVIHGTHLAEVFSIKIDKINDDSENCELYGTIQVLDEEGTLFLYKRCPENPECVCRNSCLSLIEFRERPINASKNFSILLDLKDQSGNEFINNSFFVDLMCHDDPPFNEKWRDVNVEGKMGVARINYAVFQVAVIACFSVEYKKEKDSSISNGDDHVYGSITVSYDERFGGEEKDYRFVLFEKTAEEAVQLKEEDKFKKIPMSKCFVVVPAYASLIVEGNVHLCHSNNCTQIIKISERFPTSYLPFVIKEIQGEYGYIELTIMWTNSYNMRYCREFVLN